MSRPEIKPDGVTAGQTVGSVWEETAPDTWAWNGQAVNTGDGTQIVVQHPTFNNFYFADRPASANETFKAEEAIQYRGTFADVASAVAAQDPSSGIRQSDIVIIPINGVPTPHRAEGGTYVIDDTKTPVQIAPADGFKLTEAQWDANVTVVLNNAGNYEYHLADKIAHPTYAAYDAETTFAARHKIVGGGAITNNLTTADIATDPEAVTGTDAGKVVNVVQLKAATGGGNTLERPVGDFTITSFVNDRNKGDPGEIYKFDPSANVTIPSGTTLEAGDYRASVSTDWAARAALATPPVWNLAGTETFVDDAAWPVEEFGWVDIVWNPTLAQWEITQGGDTTVDFSIPLINTVAEAATSAAQLFRSDGSTLPPLGFAAGHFGRDPAGDPVYIGG